MLRRALACLISELLTIWPVAAHPCSPPPGVSWNITAEDMVARAELIVRATAVGYAPPTAKTDRAAYVFPLIRFRVEETIKGERPGEEIVIEGNLTKTDDWNDRPAPYNLVRPEGRRGSCFALAYREGAQFLLALKHSDGRYTPYWYSLAPVNEQLHSPNDAWVQWARSHALSK